MIKGLHFVRRRQPSGGTRWYVYAWRGGPCIHKADGVRRPRLDAAAFDELNKALAHERNVSSRTIGELVREWRTSPEWAALSMGTRKTWGNALLRIEEKWGKTPLELWSDPRMTAKVVAWRDSRSETPRAADIGVTVLRTLLEFGRLRGKVGLNVATGIPTLYRSGRRAEIVWTEADIAAFVQKAHDLDRAHIADGLRLATLTGLRREDLVTLTWDQVTEFAIVKKTLKQSAGKRRHMTMPRIPELDNLLAELRDRPRKPNVKTVLVNSYGRPWSADGFGGSFNRVRDEAGILFIDPDTGVRTAKHLHDVRGTFCTHLLTRSDLNEREIADVMGWAPERVSTIRRLYVDQQSVITALGKRINQSRNTDSTLK